MSRNIKRLIVLIGLGFAVTAYASTDPAQSLPWLGAVITFLMSVPKVGAVLSQVFSVMAVVAVLLTALAAFLDALKVTLAGSAKLAGLDNLAIHISNVLDKVIPWVKYLSMYNVQKPIGAVVTAPVTPPAA
jgi:hypothetical protein